MEQFLQQLALNLVLLWKVEFGTLGWELLLVDGRHLHDDVQGSDGRLSG